MVCQGSSAGSERWSHKPEVGGSSPPLDTITFLTKSQNKLKSTQTLLKLRKIGLFTSIYDILKRCFLSQNKPKENLKKHKKSHFTGDRLEIDQTFETLDSKYKTPLRKMLIFDL